MDNNIINRTNDNKNKVILELEVKNFVSRKIYDSLLIENNNLNQQILILKGHVDNYKKIDEQNKILKNKNNELSLKISYLEKENNKLKKGLYFRK